MANYQLTDQERAVRAAYFREWRAKNRDKVSEYNKRYWQKKSATTKEERKNEK